MAPGDRSVSVVVRRRIRPELQDEFETWLEGITHAASAFEGHQGAQVLRPPDASTQDYVILFRYQTPAQLDAWQASEQRAEWIEKGHRFTLGQAHVEHLTGLEFWFHAPSWATTKPPPRHKMAVATVVGLYPLVLLVAPRVSALLPVSSHALNVLITTSTMVLLMTYAVMPTVTRILARWLFSKAPQNPT